MTISTTYGFVIRTKKDDRKGLTVMVGSNKKKAIAEATKYVTAQMYAEVFKSVSKRDKLFNEIKEEKTTKIGIVKKVGSEYLFTNSKGVYAQILPDGTLLMVTPLS